MAHAKEYLQEQRGDGTKRRCPTCSAVPELSQSMLNPRNGKTVRLYECRCGERVWDD